MSCWQAVHPSPVIYCVAQFTPKLTPYNYRTAKGLNSHFGTALHFFLLLLRTPLNSTGILKQTQEVGRASAATLFCHLQHPGTLNTGSCFSTNYVTAPHTAVCIFISNGELQLFILKYLQPTCLKSWLHSHVTPVFSSALLFTRQSLKREMKIYLRFYAEAKQSCTSAPLECTHSRQCPVPRAAGASPTAAAHRLDWKLLPFSQERRNSLEAFIFE